MLLLAFDTSTPAVTVALCEIDADAAPLVRAERTESAINRHGELLAPLVSHVLSQAGATPRDLGALGVGLGPGPFTGLRVGIVTAAAMAHSLDIPAYGVCSLDVIAADAAPGEPFAVVTDARRREVYWARYDAGGERTDGPHVDKPDVVATALRGHVTHVVGSVFDVYGEQFAGFVTVAAFPRAMQVAHLVSAKAASRAAGDPLRPLYLRRPDAVEPAAAKPVLSR